MEDVRRIAEDSDVLFIALPHGHAMKLVKAIAGLPVHIIDLGADYRFADTSVYESWYHVPHTDPEAERVYGLSELYRDAIRGAHLIGNAGCYTTASILALTPLVQEHLVQMDSILVDAVSGVSGADRRRARISRSSMTVLRRMAQSVIDTPRKSSKRSPNRQVSRLRSTLRRTLPRLHAVSLPRAMHALRTV